ncbi:hypothetical protein BDR26DRAFT_855233 [Obelidium mucronatum]|nr:hypothetical protein BDR26DRAFT_855233 [Obelidium mucronatum]
MNLLNLPSETTIDILRNLDAAALKELARTCSSAYNFIESLPLSFWKQQPFIRRLSAADKSSAFSIIQEKDSEVVRFGATPTSGIPDAVHVPLPLGGDYFNRILTSPELTVSVWIKCNPKTDNIPGFKLGYQGGIVLGSQAWSLKQQLKPSHHWPIITVSPDGQLLGSFDSFLHSPMEGGKVNDGKWHHVTLTAASYSQELYVDGIMHGSLKCATLSRLFDSGWYTHLQLGSGLISGKMSGKPEPEWNGEYPFSGAIRGLRVAKKAYSSTEVRRSYKAEKRRFRDGEGNKLPWRLALLELCEEQNKC